MKDYLSVVYNESRTPKTDYPYQLTAYLGKRYNIKEGSRILEIGFGRGEFLNAFHEMGLSCCGVDICPCDHVFGQDIKVDYIDVGKDSLPYENDFFDVVYHKSLIEHLYTPDHLMKETHRVLKSGGKGRVIILTPDWASQMAVFYEDFTHSRPYDQTAMKDLLSVYGFKQVESQLFYQLPLVWQYPLVKLICLFLQFFLSTPRARQLAKITNMKFFRWSVELMVLGSGIKQPSECDHKD